MVKQTLPRSIAYNLTRFKKIYCFVFVYVMLSFSYLPVYLWTIQLLEYQTDMRRCRFDTLGKSTPAHRAGAPTARGRWVSPRPVGESDILIATGGGPPTGRGHLVLPPTSGWMSGSLNLPDPFNLSFTELCSVT